MKNKIVFWISSDFFLINDVTHSVFCWNNHHFGQCLTQCRFFCFSSQKLKLVCFCLTFFFCFRKFEYWTIPFECNRKRNKNTLFFNEKRESSVHNFILFLFLENAYGNGRTSIITGSITNRPISTFEHIFSHSKFIGQSVIVSNWLRHSVCLPTAFARWNHESISATTSWIVSFCSCSTIAQRIGKSKNLFILIASWKTQFWI